MDVNTKISRYLTIADAIKSETAIRNGIDNSMNPDQLVNARHIATNVYDPIKDMFPNAGCYSFFRSKSLNDAVGGSPNSFHSFAGALDIDTLGNADNREIFKWVMDGNVPHNELIWEFGNNQRPEWVHVGLLPGYTTNIIIHIYNDQTGKRCRDVLTKEQAMQRFGFQ